MLRGACDGGGWCRSRSSHWSRRAAAHTTTTVIVACFASRPQCSRRRSCSAATAGARSLLVGGAKGRRPRAGRHRRWQSSRGLGVVVHAPARHRDLGSPGQLRSTPTGLAELGSRRRPLSSTFLVLAAASLVAVLTIRELRRDPAILAILALTVACVVLAELWLLDVSFQYRRSLLYAGLAMTMLVGAASSRLGRGPVWVLGSSGCARLRRTRYGRAATARAPSLRIRPRRGRPRRRSGALVSHSPRGRSRIRRWS